MADKEQKIADKEAKLAAKAALKEKKERVKKNKPKKNGDAPNIFIRILNVIKKFLKDFRGTARKIVWPDRKTVIKSTGVVLAVVLFMGTCVWLLDWGFSFSITKLTDAVAELGDNAETPTNAESTTEGTGETTTQASDEDATDEETEAVTGEEGETNEETTEADE